MLLIEPVMDSTVEQVLNFKTCCGLKAFDQNLEIRVTNLGSAPVRVPSRCELVGPGGSEAIDCLMPHGEHTLAPKATMAFYCTMDQAKWRRANGLVMFDGRGNRYFAPLAGRERGDE